MRIPDLQTIVIYTPQTTERSHTCMLIVDTVVYDEIRIA